MKRTLLLISCTVTAALVCLLILVAVSGMPDDRKNGFNRHWLRIRLRQQVAWQLPLSAERIFGCGEQLYLMALSHQQVYRLDSNMHIRDTIYLDVSKQLKPPLSFFADAAHIYVHEHNSASLLIYNLRTAAIEVVKPAAGPFLKTLQLSDSLVVVRGFIKGSVKPVFRRINIRNGMQQESDLLSEKADAGFSSDGILCSNTKKDRLFYIPYFENGIYCMDSDLKLRYKQTTIDTVYNSGIQVTSQGAGETQKLYASAPRLRVNKRAFADDRLLFIESDLRADNEDKNSFRQHPVLDTYLVEDGSYAGSFYLPVDKRKVLSYYIHDGSVYVLLKDRLLQRIKFN